MGRVRNQSDILNGGQTILMKEIGAGLTIETESTGTDNLFEVQPNSGLINGFDSNGNLIRTNPDEVSYNNTGDFDVTAADFFVCTPTVNITIAPKIGSLTAVSSTIHILNSNDVVITFPTEFIWVGGLPSLPNNYIMTLFTYNSGTTWYAIYLGEIYDQPPVTDPRTWTRLPIGLGNVSNPNHIHGIASNGTSTLIAVCENQWIHRSVDNGENWVQIKKGGNLVEIHTIDYGSGRWILGLEDGYVRYSDNDGDDWTELPQGLNSGSGIRDCNTIVTDGNGVWVAGFETGYASRSVDNGLTWTALSKGLGSGSTSYDIKSIATDGNGVWVAGFVYGYAARSIDNGTTWTSLPRGLNSGYVGAYIYSLATDGKGIWVSGHSSSYAARSIDNGATWTSLSRGLNSGNTTPHITSIATDGNGVWMSGHTSGYAAYSVNDGITWSALLRGLNSGAAVGINSIVYSNGRFIAVMDSGYASRTL